MEREGKREGEGNGTDRKVERGEREGGIGDREGNTQRETERETEGREANPNRLYHSFLTHSQPVSNFIDLSSQGNIREGLVD